MKKHSLNHKLFLVLAGLILACSAQSASAKFSPTDSAVTPAVTTKSGWSRAGTAVQSGAKAIGNGIVGGVKKIKTNLEKSIKIIKSAYNKVSDKVTGKAATREKRAIEIKEEAARNELNDKIKKENEIKEIKEWNEKNRIAGEQNKEFKKKAYVERTRNWREQAEEENSTKRRGSEKIRSINELKHNMFDEDQPKKRRDSEKQRTISKLDEGQTPEQRKELTQNFKELPNYVKDNSSKNDSIQNNKQEVQDTWTQYGKNKLAGVLSYFTGASNDPINSGPQKKDYPIKEVSNVADNK